MPDDQSILAEVDHDAENSRKGASGFGTPENPTWYDVYLVGLKTDDSKVFLDAWKSPVDPDSVTEDQIRQRVARIDDYYRSNTRGAVRVRLARWVPFAPFSVIDPCRTGFSSLMPEAQRRAGVNPSGTVVVIPVTTNPCSPYSGFANGAYRAYVFGHPNVTTIGHEFGHSHLDLQHSVGSECGFADILSACPGYREHGFGDYYDSSIMGAGRAGDALHPLLPPGLANLGLLSPSNTVTLRRPPETPINIEISDLPLSDAVSVIRLGPEPRPFYISRSPSTNFDYPYSRSVVQVTQTPEAITSPIPIQGVTVINTAGENVSTGRVRCGDSGFCMQVVSQDADRAVIRVSKQVITQIPTPPVNLRTSITGEGWIKVEWDPPVGEPTVRGYDLHYKDTLDEFDELRTYHLDASRNSLVLTEGHGRYQFAVASDTDNGTSGITTWTEAIDNRTVPGPATVRVTPGALGRAGLRAECADNGGYDITELRYYYTDDPTKPLDQWASSATGQLEGLTPHRDYTVKAQCKNDAGWGPLGQTAIRLQDVPRQPAMTKWDVKYDSEGLSFHAGLLSPNPFGDPETGVQVTLSPGGASCQNTGMSGDWFAQSCTIAGLPPGQRYTARVVLTSAIGTSEPQYLPVATEALPVSPDNGLNMRVNVDSQHRATLTWDPWQVAYGNPSITYRVEMDDVTVCTTTRTQCALPATPPRNESYVLRVYASTLAGESGPTLYLYSYNPTGTSVDPPQQPPAGSPGTESPGGGSPGNGSGGSGGSGSGTGGASGAQLANQTLKKLPKKVRIGKRVTLPRASVQGMGIRWSTSTPKKCTVKTYRLVPRKQGVCRVVADAPATAGFRALRQVVIVKVRGHGKRGSS
jgi:hypothetical protein